MTFRTLTVTIVLLAAFAYLGVASQAEEIPPRRSLSQLPMTIGERVGRREPDLAPDILQVLGVDDYIVRSYSAGANLPVGLYAGYYKSQRQGDAIHSPLNCLPGAGWIPAELGHTTLQVQETPGGLTRSIEVNRVVIEKGMDKQLVYYWYQSHGRVVASEYWGKIYTVLDSVRYHRTDAALVRVVVPIPDANRAAEADRVAVSFVQGLFPLLGDYLPT